MAKKTISPEQKKVLLEFMEEHPELVTQKQSNQFTNADTARLWQEISLKLNAIPGATKTWKEWRKTWSDMKTRTKRKVADNRKEANKTGGGPNPAEGVDEIDNKIMDMISGDIIIEGLDIPEIGIPDDMPEFENNNNVNSQPQPTQHTHTEDIVADMEDIDENKTPAIPHTTPKLTNRSTSGNKKIRPPVGVSYRRKNSAGPNSAALELVEVTERTNKIEEQYYKKKKLIINKKLMKRR